MEITENLNTTSHRSILGCDITIMKAAFQCKAFTPNAWSRFHL
jgi:hypothetical protein